MTRVSTRALWSFVAVGVVVLSAGVASGARWMHRSRAQGPLPTGAGALELRVRHAAGSITLDGDTDDPGWQGDVARTGAFVGPDGQTAARPHSEAKLAWGDGFLYVELYAADQDIRATHETADGPVFSDGTTEHSFDLSPLGTLTDGERKVATCAGCAHPFDYRWTSGAHVSHELDGTPNQPSDHDEEWVLEMAIPFDALGLAGAPGERVGFAAHRCDTLASGERSCGSWGEGERKGVIVLE